MSFSVWDKNWVVTKNICVREISLRDKVVHGKLVPLYQTTRRHSMAAFVFSNVITETASSLEPSCSAASLRKILQIASSRWICVFCALPATNSCYTMRRREVAETCALLDSFSASSGNILPTFRDNLSAPSSGFKNPNESLLPKHSAQRTQAPPVVFFSTQQLWATTSPTYFLFRIALY